MGDEIISRYTDAEALEDGELMDTSKYSHSINRVTSGLLAKGYENNVPNLMDLMRQAEHKYNHHEGDDWFFKVQVEFPNGDSGDIFMVLNETGKFTLMLPEDY